MKKALSLVLALAFCFSLASCGTKDTTSGIESAPQSQPESTPSQSEPQTESQPEEEPMPSGPDYAAKMKAMYFGEGEYADLPVVTMETTAGTIKMRLFPSEAPLAVENFIGLINKGYYDGVIFHRVIQDFMIQSGDPQGTGMGGDSIWEKDFDIEYSLNMWHLRGCLAMANTGRPTSNGSQFYIVQGNFYNQMKDQMAQYGFPQEVIDLYAEYGGRPDLDLLSPEQGRFGYTKFGYVIEGMDVVDKIASVKVNKDGLPDEEIKIVKMTVTEK